MPETQIWKNSFPMFLSSKEVQVCQEEYPHWKGGQALEGASLGGGGVPIPEGVQEVTGCGTQGSGLVDKDGVWSRIGPDDLGGFFQLKCFYDSVILYISLNTCSKDTEFYTYRNNKVLFWRNSSTVSDPANSEQELVWDRHLLKEVSRVSMCLWILPNKQTKNQAETENFGLKSGQLKTSSYLCSYLCLYEEICISQNNWPDVPGRLGISVDAEIRQKLIWMSRAQLRDIYLVIFFIF